MKLCDISSFYSDSGGGVRTYHEQKKRFFSKSQDHAYVLIIPSTRFSVERSDRITIYRVRGFVVARRPVYRQIWDLFALRRILMQERPDVIEIGSCYLDNWLAMASTLGCAPVLAGFYHADFPDSYMAPAVGGFPKPIAKRFIDFWKRYVRFVYGSFDVTCVSSAYVQEKLMSYGIDNTHKVPLGVDTDRFHPRHRSLELRRSMGLQPEERLILYVGRFSSEKGIDTLLAALPALAAVPESRVVLVGRGPLLQKVEQRAQAFERVTVLPHIDDRDTLARLYASADVFLSPGPYETFGLSTLEAMASGLPVAVAAQGGAAELVQAAKGGALFKPGSADDLVAAVTKLISADAPKVGRQARQHVVATYSWDATFRSMLTLYQHKMAEKRRRHPLVYPQEQAVYRRFRTT